MKRQLSFDGLERRDACSGFDFGGTHNHIGGNAVIFAGQTFARHGVFIVPNPADTVVAKVDYALGFDGVPSMPLPLSYVPLVPGTTGTFVLSHVYPRPGVYTVFVLVYDTTHFGISESFVNVVVRPTVPVLPVLPMRFP
jgi:hypothetical protein